MNADICIIMMDKNMTKKIIKQIAKKFSHKIYTHKGIYVLVILPI